MQPAGRGKLSDLINVSLTQGRVPLEWKQTNTVPIFKGGSKINSLNYRPVSLAIVEANICEKNYKKQMGEILEKQQHINE